MSDKSPEVGEVWETIERGVPREVTVLEVGDGWGNGFVVVMGKRRSEIRRHYFVGRFARLRDASGKVVRAGRVVVEEDALVRVRRVLDGYAVKDVMRDQMERDLVAAVRGG